MHDASAPSPDRKAAGPRAGRLATLVAALVVAVGLAYGAGWLRASGRIAAADARARAASASASARLAELSEAAQRLAELEARRSMHLAEVALDARNFGTAETHLHAAGAVLRADARSRELAELGGTLANVHLKATEDLGGERQRIVGWIKRFDEVVPPAPP
jgi:hypothetical protein